MSCPSLRHLCLYFPHTQTVKGIFSELSGLQYNSLSNLQTLHLQLQGGQALVELRGIDFQHSSRLEVFSSHNCWMDDLSLPPSCQVYVSAQPSSFIVHMDESRGHPLVCRASHVCLPTDLAERVTAEGYYDAEDYDQTEDAELQRSATGIPDMFPAMRSLRLTWPHWGCRPIGQQQALRRCFTGDYHAERQEYCGLDLMPMRCLTRQWQHANLKELLIEGGSLGITIPALPSSETLLVSCYENVALDIVDPEYLGRTINSMSIIAKRVHFHTQQLQDLRKALEARDLKLTRMWRGYNFVCVHASSEPSPTEAELLEQARQGFECHCRACPACLGIGQSMLNREDPPRHHRGYTPSMMSNMRNTCRSLLWPDTLQWSCMV